HLLAEQVRRRLPAARTTVLQEMLHLDAQTALVDNLLLYFDKMSMAASLEVRVPFMDHDVVAFCAALPDGRRLSLRSALRGKAILRDISRDLVGPETIAKKKRGFFRSAVSAWLGSNTELVREVLLDPGTLGRGLFSRSGIDTLLDPGTPRWY